MNKANRVRQTGFTLLELMIVLVVVLVVTIAAAPSVLNTMQGIRLRSSAESVGGMLQRARMQAVKDNKYYSLVFTTVGSLEQVCVDTAYAHTSCSSGEPTAEFSTNVAPVTSGYPSTGVITCGSVGTPTTCPTGYTGLNYIPEGASVPPSYNARGLPCVGTPHSPPTYPTDQCLQIDPTTTNPVGYLYVFQYGSVAGAYTAVSVTPAGLVTVWAYQGKDASNNDVWVQE